MAYTYRSGQEIRTGDRIVYAGHPGRVDFVAHPAADPTNWYVTEYGGGVMIDVPQAMGAVFLSDPQDDEDLEFVSRQPDQS